MNITNAVRSSEYFQSIPALSVECTELDGDCSSLPVIFEDIYAEQVITSLAMTTTNTLPASQQQALVELRDSSMTVDSEVSCSSQVTWSDSRMSSMSEVSRRASRLRLRAQRRAESMRHAAGSSLVASDEDECTLVGYRKMDVSGNEYRPTVALGTLTTATCHPITHTQSLVGSGIVLQPSLLCSAVSLPTLHTASSDIATSLTGSMPTLPATDNSSSETDLTPYWRSQQGKAQLVAQHSNEATATPLYFDPAGTAAASDDVVSNDIDFTLGTDLDSAVDTDLDTTVGYDLQRAVGNDLYMAEGVDLDTTLMSKLAAAAGEDNVEACSAAATCDSDEHNISDDDITADDDDDANAGTDAGTADDDDDDANDAITADDDASTDAAVTVDQLHSVSTSAAAAAGGYHGDDSDARGLSAAADSSVTASVSVSRQTCVDINTSEASLIDSSHVTAADDGRDNATCMSTDVNTAELADSQTSIGNCLSSTSASVPTSTSLTHNDNSEQCMTVTHETADDVSCGQCVSDLRLSAEDAAGNDASSVKSVSDVKQSSADSNGQSVSEIAADELSTVIPSSCDSVSDDERYLSGQCTLLELISEDQNTQRRRLVGCSDVSDDIAQQQQQQPCSDEVKNDDNNTAERTEVTSRADSGDGASSTTGTVIDKAAKRLISVVSDDTLHFIGAKEKLRKQLTYSGHFYR